MRLSNCFSDCAARLTEEEVEDYNWYDAFYEAEMHELLEDDDQYFSYDDDDDN